ncbi:MAG: LysE family translocator, partial [Luminiphilus sp.]
MSPGPSLVVVVRQSFAGGSRAGITCAIAHGVGIFLWAAMMVSGLGALVIASPDLFLAFRFAGAVFLIYLAYKIAFSKPDSKALIEQPITFAHMFLLQFVNTKGRMGAMIL